MIGQSSKQSFTGRILEGCMLVASVLLLERFLVENRLLIAFRSTWEFCVVKA